MGSLWRREVKGQQGGDSHGSWKTRRRWTIYKCRATVNTIALKAAGCHLILSIMSDVVDVELESILEAFEQLTRAHPSHSRKLLAARLRKNKYSTLLTSASRSLELHYPIKTLECWQERVRGFCRIKPTGQSGSSPIYPHIRGVWRLSCLYSLSGLPRPIAK